MTTQHRADIADDLLIDELDRAERQAYTEGRAADEFDPWEPAPEDVEPWTPIGTRLGRVWK
jgi:hypothetical protein